MDVNFAFLCDYAEAAGKITAVGVGFDTIHARSVPTTHPLFYAVIQLRFSTVELGEKRFGVRVIDADGHDIVPPLDGSINVTPPPGGYTYKTHNIALALHGVRFPSFGDYSVRWLVEGNEVKSVPLKIVEQPAPPTTG
ncbi:MAG: hypothetical protein ACE5KI_06550 [Dehalococcoidia bacterium]